MNYWASVAVLIAGCVGMPPPQGGVVASQFAQPPSLRDAATQARSAGGFVAVVRLVSVGEPTQAPLATAGRDDAFLTYDQASFILEVVNPLGESLEVSERLEAVGRVGPEYVVDEAGEPLEGWTVTGGAPTASQRPPDEGDFAVFTFGLSRDSQRILIVAPVNDGIASGENAADGLDVALDALVRRD